MLHFKEIFAFKSFGGLHKARCIEVNPIPEGYKYMGKGLIDGTNVNIWKNFTDKSEYVWFIRGPIFKMLVVIFEGLYETSWHNEKDRVIVDIL